jgi:signal transduction histidine kinase
VMSTWAHVLGAQDCDDSTRMEAAQAIEASVRAQLGLIDGVLELSRLLAGVRGKVTSVPVIALLRAEVERAAPSASQKGVALEVTGRVAHVRGDAKRLSRAFESAISATLAFTQPGGRVVVSTSRTVAAVRIDVRGAAGEGVPSLDDAAQTATRSGFGMALARAIIAQHEGTIEATTAGYAISLPVAAGPRPRPRPRRRSSR